MITMKKVMTGLLAIAMLMSMTTSAFAAAFADVPSSHWSYEYVEKAYANNLVNGTGTGNYEPDRSVSYAEWATMICNLFYTDEVAAFNALSTPSVWHMTYFRVVSAHNILSGTNCTYTGYGTASTEYEKVHNSITRYDMAQAIYNLSNAQNWTSGDTSTISSSIADWSSVPSNYQTAVAYCYASGFITGIDAKGTFAGTEPMTRGAAAVVLCRMLDAKNGEHNFNSGTNSNTNTGYASATEYVNSVLSVTKITTASRGTDYSVTINNSYTAGKLANGKDITDANIAEILAALEVIFPGGTSWVSMQSTGDRYYYQGTHSTGGNWSNGVWGCDGFAMMTRDLLYGVGSAKQYTTSSDLTTVKPGDLVHLLNNSTGYDHWIVVTGYPTTDAYGITTFATAEGNMGSIVTWTMNRSLSAMLKNNSMPDSVVYSFY